MVEVDGDRIVLPIDIVIDAKTRREEKRKLPASSSSAPFQRRSSDEGRTGAIFGGRDDPAVKGFQKRKTVQRNAFRDKSSKTPADVVSEFKLMKAELKQVKEGQKEGEKKRRELEKKVQQRDDFLNDILGNGLNPAGAASKLFSFLPHTFIIALLLESPEIIDKIIQELTRPGGALDIRFKRDIPREVEQFLTRELQQATQIGRRHVTIQSIAGFRNSDNGRLNSNTLQQLNDSGGIGIGSTAIGLTEKALGVK